MKNRRPLVICLLLALLSIVALALAAPYLKRHYESVNCGNYMASIGCGAQVWALDNGGRLPADFRSMSNELSTTRVLVCPGDHKRIPAISWSALDETNCSYEIIAPGMSGQDSSNVYFRCRVHGHLGYSDGTVFDGKKRRAKAVW